VGSLAEIVSLGRGRGSSNGASDLLLSRKTDSNCVQRSDDSYKGGHLFSTLRLPISTGLPVNIHALFSISADRSRLHGFEHNGTLDRRPETWNKFLFNDMIPKAWAKLLSNLALARPEVPQFLLWPTKISSPQELWYGICSAILAHVVHNSLAVWYTEVGYVSLQDGLLAADLTPSATKKMFYEAKLPVILVAEYLLSETRQLIDSSSLPLLTLCEHLRRAGSMERLSDTSRLVLLELLLLEKHFTDFDDFAIFPFQDGKFRSLQQSPNFLHRDGSEQMLFRRQQEKTIDTNKLTDTAAQCFHTQSEKNKHTVRYRTTEDLRDYFLEFVFHGPDDVVVLEDRDMPLLDEIWKWILKYGERELNLAALGSLWLLPLRDGGVRKLVPLDSANLVTWFCPGQIKDISIALSALDPESAPKMLADDVLSNEVVQYLLLATEKEPCLRLKNGQKLMDFLDFLVQGRSVLRGAAGAVTKSILHGLRQLQLAESTHINDSTREKFKSLSLFDSVHWPTNTTGLSLHRKQTDLMGDCNFIGIRKIMPIPPNSRYVFLDATGEDEQNLLGSLGSLRCLNELQVLEEVVIPALQDDCYDNMNPNLRCEVVELLFKNYHHLSASAQACLSDLPIVPMRLQTQEDVLSFGLSSDMLDPNKPELANLYFDGELRYPEQTFYDRFRDLLARFGMIQFLSERVVLDRVRHYQRRGNEFDMVHPRAKHLLETQFRCEGTQCDDFIDTIRRLKWLPARAADSSTCISNAAECRDVCDEPLVGRVWHILPFPVEHSWKELLGWHESINVDVLMAQMVQAIAVSDVPSVEQTLCYLHRHHSFESYSWLLLDLSFVRSISGELISIPSVCRWGAERLEPYLHVVDPRFWDDHTQLMELAEVPELPTENHLRAIQSALQVQELLNEKDLGVAIELTQIWSSRFCESVDGLRLPSNRCVLVDISDLSYNDVLWSPVEHHVVLHPEISRTVAALLRIPLRSELLRNGALGIADADDDEFDQREDVVDGIRDTLDRYTRESTFLEFIANADDCGSASDVNFLFDGGTYMTDSVLTEDMQALQGPSLLIHNNGGE
jgi:sacsin